MQGLFTTGIVISDIGCGLKILALRCFCPWTIEPPDHAPYSKITSKALEFRWGDFYPWNSWKVTDRSQLKVVDQTTGRSHLNDSHLVIRIKLLLAGTFGGVGHAVAMVSTIAYRGLRLVTFFSFWQNLDKAKPYALKDRACKFGKDLAHLAASPLILIAIEVSAIYGVVFCPRDGRKLFANFERLQYGDWLVAPCFQPTFGDPIKHAFGGQADKVNVY